MPTRSSEATWEGSLQQGSGSMELGSGMFSGEYSFVTRFGDEDGTNPEELIAAAHAGCYAMALSGALGEEGYEPERIHAKAHVHLDDDSLSIDQITLEVEATVPDIDEETFMEFARGAKEDCPVSKVLAGAEIDLDATLA